MGTIVSKEPTASIFTVPQKHTVYQSTWDTYQKTVIFKTEVSYTDCNHVQDKRWSLDWEPDDCRLVQPFQTPVL